MKYAKIAVSEVTFWVDSPYDYAVPQPMEDVIAPGMRVTVPFSRGNRRAEGIVLSVSDQCDYDAPKNILSLLDAEPVLSDARVSSRSSFRGRSSRDRIPKHSSPCLKSP